MCIRIQAFPGHYFIGYLTYNLYLTILGINPTLPGIVFSILVALLPDIDAILLLFSYLTGKGGKSRGTEFRHHGLPSHYPIIYTPLLILLVFFPNIYTYSLISGIYLHLFVDSIYTSDGIKWLYPFKKEFYGFLNKQTKGKHGIFWLESYMKTPLYKIEFILMIIGLIILWLNHIFYYHIPLWGLLLLGSLLICFGIGAFLVERAHVRYVERIAREERLRAK
ncbi:MAG: metal-dependent hydrolase [Candidatus Helarchaeota archaeon]